MYRQRNNLQTPFISVIKFLWFKSVNRVNKRVSPIPITTFQSVNSFSWLTSWKTDWKAFWQEYTIASRLIPPTCKQSFPSSSEQRDKGFGLVLHVVPDPCQMPPTLLKVIRPAIFCSCSLFEILAPMNVERRLSGYTSPARLKHYDRENIKQPDSCESPETCTHRHCHMTRCNDDKISCCVTAGLRSPEESVITVTDAKSKWKWSNGSSAVLWNPNKHSSEARQA